MVTIKVGANKVEFNAPKNSLCAASPFFRSAFTHDWAEKQQGMLHLAEDKPQTFSILLQWILSGSIVLRNEPTAAIKRRDEWLSLLDLYVLADRLAMTSLKNEVMDIVNVDGADEKVVPSGLFCKQIYTRTPEGSKFVEWALDRWVYFAAGSYFRAHDIEKCVPFFAIVMQRFKDFDGYSLRKARRQRQEKCYYHEHDAETPVCK